MNLIAHAHSTLASFAPSRTYMTPSSSSAMSGEIEPELLPEEMSVEELTPIVRDLCVGGTGYPATGGDGVRVKDVTSALTWNARAALYPFYVPSRASIRWVTELSQLDQEEALALVLAHLRGYALLPEEARNIGELARLAAIAYKGKPPGAKGKAPKKKPADQVLKDNASTAKSQARAAAAKDATLAAGLMERLEGIDAVAATNRRQLARAPVSLPWPPRATVITTRAAPRPKPRTSELARLRKAAVVAAEQVKAAECDYAASKRVAERAKHVVDKYVALQREMLSQLCPRKLLDSNGQIKEPEVCEHDYEACAAATERARALYDEVRAGRDEDEDALLVARRRRLRRRATRWRRWSVRRRGGRSGSGRTRSGQSSERKRRWRAQ